MKYYCIGIKGSGMSTLANLMYDLGNDIIGYDDADGYKFTMKGLLERNIKIYQGDNYPELPKGTIVTYTAAIDFNHHEVKRVKDLGYEVIPYKELMGRLSKEFNTICVCGTHGKTTTSLMIYDILNQSLGCSCFVGDGTGKGNKDSNIMVMESCEFNKHFLSYYPYDIVLTNIELDHTETYPTIDDMIKAFQKFVDKRKNKIVLCGDDSNIRKLKVDNGYYYGFNDNNNVVIKNKVVNNNKTCFDIYINNEFFDHYELSLFGDHMILDATGAITLSYLYNIDKKIIKDVLSSFVPANRRFNEKVVGDNIIVDDYAHHPTEIRVTYDSAKQKYHDKKIIGVFLPNTYSRTEALFDDFVKSLSLFDKAYVMDISCDRENPLDYPNISSDKLVENIPNSEIISLDTVDKLVDYHNSVICFMSCANISKMIDKYISIIKK